FDPASFVIGGHSPLESFRMLHPLVVHFRARDAVRGFDGTPQEVALGRGEVVWDELMIMLLESNFSGWTTVDRNTGDDKPGELSRAVEYLTNVTTV
ncbi:MAG: sugar phosphate isomerase/epimerase, partial [Planctomycetota bacterium]|nr:sugar phosphate isomerase/epimerase [Planctomycetota bacterium]